jgi:hypothetical protein
MNEGQPVWQYNSGCLCGAIQSFSLINKPIAIPPKVIVLFQSKDQKPNTEVIVTPQIE